MAATLATLSKEEINDLALTYAALLLHDGGVNVTVRLRPFFGATISSSFSQFFASFAHLSCYIVYSAG